MYVSVYILFKRDAIYFFSFSKQSTFFYNSFCTFLTVFLISNTKMEILSIVHFLLIILMIVVTGYGFTMLPKQRCRTAAILLRAKVEVADSASITDGKTQVVKTVAGEVIIGNLKGKFYAVDAKCPHLGNSFIFLSMLPFYN